MNRTIVFVIFIAAEMASLRTADALNSSKLVKFGTETVALFDGVKSPDGRYAVGWTIRPKSKHAKPVDWSAWGNQQHPAFKFLSRYEFGRESDPYEINDCFVDLQQNKVLILPSDWPYWPHKNHGSLDAAWSSVSGKLKYALLQNEARFSTANLWLIAIDETGMHYSDIAPRLDGAVRQFLTAKKVIDGYAISYPLHGKSWGAPGEISDVSFKGSSAVISFGAEIPKSTEAPVVFGSVTVSLPDGGVGQVTGSQPPQATSNTSYGLVGGSDEPAESPPEPAASHETHTLNTVFDHGPYADYNHYSQRQILRRAQRKLRKAGLYHGGIDGAMGPSTQAAIIEWQERENIPVTGLLDHQTLQSMYLLGLAEQTPPQKPIVGEPVRESPPPPDPDAAEVISRVLQWIPH